MKTRIYKPMLSAALLLLSILACNISASSDEQIDRNDNIENSFDGPTATFEASFSLPASQQPTSPATKTIIPTTPPAAPPTKTPTNTATNTPTPTSTPIVFIMTVVMADPHNASISGSVWNDANGNGVRDSGELGIYNQPVYLELGPCAMIKNSETMTALWTGAYRFTGVYAGSYCVWTVITKDCNGRSQDILVKSPISVDFYGENKKVPALGASCSLLTTP